MTRQQILTVTGGAVLAAGLLFSGPPSARAGELEAPAAGSADDQPGRYLRAGSVRQAKRPLMQALK